VLLPGLATHPLLPSSARREHGKGGAAGGVRPRRKLDEVGPEVVALAHAARAARTARTARGAQLGG